MPKQYGSNGINSDGSLMNVGNTISGPSKWWSSFKITYR